MFTQSRIEVSSVGESVTLEIGNWRRSMDYETALLLSWWMTKCARMARKWTGSGAQMLACATLSDAEKPDAGQPFNPLRVRTVLPDALKAEQIRTDVERDLVVVAFGADEMRLPHKAALTIAQWIRMRAKESKRRAGDLGRHWSVIGTQHDLQAGPDVTRG